MKKPKTWEDTMARLEGVESACSAVTYSATDAATAFDSLVITTTSTSTSPSWTWATTTTGTPMTASSTRTITYPDPSHTTVPSITPVLFDAEAGFPDADFSDIEAMIACGELDTDKGRKDFVRSFERYLNSMYLSSRYFSIGSGTTAATLSITEDGEAIVTGGLGSATLFKTPSLSYNITIGGFTYPVKEGAITYDRASNSMSFSGSVPIYNSDGTYAGECTLEVPLCAAPAISKAPEVSLSSDSSDT